MDSKKAVSDFFEAQYLKAHKNKKDDQRAALLQKLAKGKLHASRKKATKKN
jgi:hypothetical protein